MKESEIEGIVEEILNAHEINNLPIDPLYIAKLESIKLLPSNYGGKFDGLIEYRKEKSRWNFYLYYETSAPYCTEGRIRFSIAHELGHFYIPEHRDYLLSGLSHGSHIDFVSDKQNEREADYFAAALLMPQKKFIENVSQKSGNVCTLKELTDFAQNLFNTSIISTVIRYVRLCIEPCCVVLSKKGRVLYSVPSDDIHLKGYGWIKRDTLVPPPSITKKISTITVSGGNLSEEGAVDSDVWFEGRPSVRMWEDVITLGRTGLVLTLLSMEEN